MFAYIKKKTGMVLGLMVAARAVELDNVNIVPVTKSTNCHHTITTLMLPGWKERLVDLAVDHVNNDIKNYKKIKKRPTFTIFSLNSHYYYFLFFVSIKLDYTLS